MTPMEFASYFDHTCLRQDMTQRDLEKLMKETNEFGFWSICIPPLFVPDARAMDRALRITTVIDFPLGYMGISGKVSSAASAIEDGADELDLVASVALLKNQDYTRYAAEIRGIRSISEGMILKVILETSLLTPEEIRLASRICQDEGADFVKTSTGFGSRGASLEDLKAMRHGAPDCRIKASGGIRNLESALGFIDAGASRIGSSNSAQILSDFMVR